MSQGRAARRKGHSFEREIAAIIRELDPSAKRNSAEAQQASFDILTTLPLAIQCKNFSRWHVTPHDVYNQAAQYAGERMPVGIVRISHKAPDLVILNFKDFFNILRKLYGDTEKNQSINCCP